MDANLDLNTSGSLPDGTKASQSGGFGVTTSDLKRGFKRVESEREQQYDDPNSQHVLGGEPENKDGGFLGRPDGWQR